MCDGRLGIFVPLKYAVPASRVICERGIIKKFEMAKADNNHVHPKTKVNLETTALRETDEVKHLRYKFNLRIGTFIPEL